MLEEGKLAFSSGTAFGARGEGHLRFCMATSETLIKDVFDRLEKALAKLK
jgi:aspartate/methionine/tyrosine aminotransferase